MPPLSWKTSLASAIIPGLGQVINGHENRAIVIWTGLVLSVLLFPLPVFGTPTFAGIYLANIVDAYNPDRKFEFIDIKVWKQKSWDQLISKIKKKSS